MQNGVEAAQWPSKLPKDLRPRNFGYKITSSLVLGGSGGYLTHLGGKDFPVCPTQYLRREMDGDDNVLTLASISFDLHFDKGGTLSPWLGIVLRGAFGAVLRSVSCGLRNASCPECMLGLKCAYGYLFETPALTHNFGRKLSHAPHPFVFKPPMIDEIGAGASVRIELTLVGNAIDYYPYFVVTLSELGRRGLGRERATFTVERIQCLRTGERLDPDRTLHSDIPFLLDFSKDRDRKQYVTARFQVNLKTLLRLRSNGQQVFHFDFRSLVASMVRRVELIGQWHCGTDLYGRFSHLLHESRSVKVVTDNTYFHDWVRFSKRQGQRMPVGGAIGPVVLEGEYECFSSLFEAARYLSVGHQTSFGLGQIDFERLN